LFVVTGDFLTEINVSSPTGIRAIARLYGPDVAAKIWNVIEKKRGSGLSDFARCSSSDG
jgi:glutathione synthase